MKTNRNDRPARGSMAALLKRRHWLRVQMTFWIIVLALLLTSIGLDVWEMFSGSVRISAPTNTVLEKRIDALAKRCEEIEILQRDLWVAYRPEKPFFSGAGVVVDHSTSPTLRGHAILAPIGDNDHGPLRLVGWTSPTLTDHAPEVKRVAPMQPVDGEEGP